MSLSCSVLWQGPRTCLFLHFLRFSFVVLRDGLNLFIPKILSFFIIIKRSDLLARIRWSVCTSKFQRNVSVSFSRTDSYIYIYHLLVWLNINFLHNYYWITIPTQSCLVLYSLCDSCLHSLIIWLIVPSLSPHKQHLHSSSSSSSSCSSEILFMKPYNWMQTQGGTSAFSMT